MQTSKTDLDVLGDTLSSALADVKQARKPSTISNTRMISTILNSTFLTWDALIFLMYAHNTKTSFLWYERILLNDFFQCKINSLSKREFSSRKENSHQSTFPVIPLTLTPIRLAPLAQILSPFIRVFSV
jgi:hypothetical protein